MPGVPGPPGPPRRAGGRALVVGASIAVVVLLVAGGLVVWSVTSSRPYASLPTCRQLLNDIVDELPHAESPRVEGEYLELDEYIDEYGYREEEDLEGLEGFLQCTVRETAETGDEDDHWSYHSSLMRVNVSLHDAEDERAMEDLRAGVEEEVEDLEDGGWGEELDDFELVDWARLTVGDGGSVTLYETNYGEREGTAFARFIIANASVVINYTLEERYDEQEELEFMTSFSGQLGRQLDREAERG